MTDKGTKRQWLYDDALEVTGHGRYNIGLLFACFLIITAMAIDIYGLGIIVTAATKHLQLSLGEVGVLSSMPFAGIIVMSYPWGYLSDTKGRKLVLMWSMGGSFVSAALSSLAPNWQTLAVLRFISSALSSAGESATYALLGECCVSRLRAGYMLFVTSALMISSTIYYLAAYFVMKLEFSIPMLGIEYSPWRLLTLVMALPLGLSAVVLWYFSESPKFLFSVGREAEALEALKRIYIINGGKADMFPVEGLENDEEIKVKGTSVRSFWDQIAPLFKPPLLSNTLLLYYLTIVVFIANNSCAVILPTIFNLFFESYAVRPSGGFCSLLGEAGNTTRDQEHVRSSRNDMINDNTIWAGCAHGVGFFLLNVLISVCANKRKILTLVILITSSVSALAVDKTGEPISGLVLFYIYLTTAMVFGVISSYFVDLYPTSYRGMVACLGLMVGRLSAFAGTNIISNTAEQHCSTLMYTAAALVLSGVLAALFLPSDTSLLVSEGNSIFRQERKRNRISASVQVSSETETFLPMNN